MYDNVSGIDDEIKIFDLLGLIESVWWADFLKNWFWEIWNIFINRRNQSDLAEVAIFIVENDWKTWYIDEESLV